MAQGIDLESAKLCVGEGWHPLLEEIYARLLGNAYVTQVKEKYGGLRFYVDYTDGATQNFIWNIEEKSYTVCEFCGAPGEPRKGGWIKTLCDKCHIQREKDGIIAYAKALCKKFIAKVETKRAVSKETYAEYKALLEKIERVETEHD